MNKTHRLIWNALTQSWVVVSEIAKSQGKRASGVLLLSAAISALPAMAQAAEPLPNQLPTGGNVVAGTATITQSAATMPEHRPCRC